MQKAVIVGRSNKALEELKRHREEEGERVLVMSEIRIPRKLRNAKNFMKIYVTLRLQRAASTFFVDVRREVASSPGNVDTNVDAARYKRNVT